MYIWSQTFLFCSCLEIISFLKLLNSANFDSIYTNLLQIYSSDLKIIISRENVNATEEW